MPPDMTQNDRVFFDMSVHGEPISGGVLRDVFEDLPHDFAVDDVAASLTEMGVTYSYRAALRLIQRLRKGGLIAKHGGKTGQSVRWRRASL